MAYKKIKKDGTPAQKPGRKPDPNKAPKRPPMFYKGVERPHVWKCGPDKEKHNMYVPWMRSKAQANFRDEGWDLDFEEFYELWKGKWHLRGRAIENLCMSRKDFSKPWTKENTIVITRKEHLINQGIMRVSKGKDYYKKGLPGPKPAAQYKKLKVT